MMVARNDLIEDVVVLLSFSTGIFVTFYYVMPSIDVPLWGKIIFGIQFGLTLGFIIAIALMPILNVVKSIIQRLRHGD